jgi:trk system potassium uptake protein TrkH
MNFSPSKTLISFFLIIITIGTILLSLPISLNNNVQPSLLTNLFTAVSATCVAGLSVIQIADYYSIFGQIVILVLIQIGGLGYMFVSTVAAILFGKMALKDRRILQELFDITSFQDLKKLLTKTIIFVFAIEILGALLLTIFYLKQFPFLKSAYFGIFTSISAFCNSGFSPFNNSLCDFFYNPAILSVLMVLSIIGGLGFFVMIDIYDTYKEKRLHISLNSKIVLVFSLVILVCSFIFFMVYGENSFFKDEGVLYSVINSLFGAASVRTAGFNTIEMSVYNEFAKMLFVIVMAIGAAPAGTAGGLKVTTLAVVIVFLRSFLKSKEEVTIFNKKIPDDIVQKATVIFVLFVILIAVFSSILILLEPDKDVMDIFFEVVSAFSTTGLSINLTDKLSSYGRIVIILAMIVGRIGILTLLLSVVNSNRKMKLKYPEERILVG